MSLKHTILGFLSFKSMSGYDLKKAFDNSVQHFWPADQSQIYRTLKQLDKDGLITKEVIEREDRLDVKLYEVTEAGRAELLDWLATPPPAEAARDPLLIKVYFAFMLQDEQALHLLQTEIDQIDSLLSVFQEVYNTAMSQEHTDDVQRAMFFSMLTLEYGIKSNLWVRSWLQSVVDRIAEGNMTIASLEDLMNPSNKQRANRLWRRSYRNRRMLVSVSV